MIGRRALLAGGLAAGSATPFPTQGAARRRIAIVALGRADGRPAPIMPNLTTALEELGYADGRTASIGRWSAGGALSALPRLAVEVAGSAPEVIVAAGASVLDAFGPSTSPVPIVVAGANVDPVAAGYIRSFARPGGRITGLTTGNDEALAKQVQIIKEFVPGVQRLAVLWTRGNAVTAPNAAKAAAAAESFALKTEIVALERADAAAAVSSLADGKTALFAISDPAMDDLREVIASAAIEARLAAGSQLPFYVDAGFLVGYTADLTALHRRAAMFVHRILQGVAPAELPFEAPTLFRLRINALTARAIGVRIPSALLALADEVIE